MNNFYRVKMFRIIDFPGYPVNPGYPAIIDFPVYFQAIIVKKIKNMYF